MSNSQIISVIAVCLAVVAGGVLFFAYQRWYLPRRSRQTVERLRREEDAGVPPSPSDYHFAISFDSESLTVTDLRSRTHDSNSMRWAEVHRATAFKRDFFTVDWICLFFARPDDTGIELDEEMAGWRRLATALPMHLPGCRASDEWFSAVAFPAFAPNPTEIYCHATTNANVA